MHGRGKGMEGLFFLNLQFPRKYSPAVHSSAEESLLGWQDRNNGLFYISPAIKRASLVIAGHASAIFN